MCLMREVKHVQTYIHDTPEENRVTTKRCRAFQKTCTRDGNCILDGVHSTYMAVGVTDQKL